VCFIKLTYLFTYLLARMSVSWNAGLRHLFAHINVRNRNDNCRSCLLIIIKTTNLTRRKRELQGHGTVKIYWVINKMCLKSFFFKVGKDGAALTIVRGRSFHTRAAATPTRDLAWREMIRPQAARRAARPPCPQCAIKWDRNLKPKLAIMRQCTSVIDRRTLTS